MRARRLAASNRASWRLQGPRSQRPAKVGVSRGAAPDLAARCLEHRAGRGQHDDVGRQPERFHDPVPHHGIEPLPGRGVLFTRLGDHHESLGPRPRIRDAERGDAASSHPWRGADQRLDLLGIQVAAGLDDHVLGDDPAPPVQIGMIEGESTAAVECYVMGLVAPAKPALERGTPVRRGFTPQEPGPRTDGGTSRSRRPTPAVDRG